ncbi:MAG TPA: lipase family protein [Verrucomicrobiota bacterium]|nr:lipase family protein [Verrucomicrobiota bacterium]HNU50091.1 lipase family protein [Verrucomicrobiota bacterium]
MCPQPVFFLLPATAALALAASLAAQPVAPQIHQWNLSPEGPTLHWTDAGPGQVYTVQICESFEDPLWITPRTPFPWPVPTRTWTDQTAPPNDTRFYRVLASPAANRGSLLRTDTIESYTKTQINFMLSLLGVPLAAQYDVTVHRLTYETLDPWGGRTEATGAIALPVSPTKPLPLCSYQHGTLAERSEAPSYNSSIERFLGVALAASGYVATLPDYLGLGGSPLIHPYHHADSQATAAVDMLRAARTACAARSLSLNGQLFLIGYSQGGHATLALHRDLEQYHASEFTITASAPMAGAYDLSGVTTTDVLSGRPMPNPYYFALILASYQSVYRLAPSLADLLAPEYQTTLPPLLDGQHTGEEINAILPQDVTRVLHPNVLAGLRTRPNHPLRQALRDNDLYRWTPQAPLRLYHCGGDQDVIIANSQVALAAFHARGATHVELVVPDPNADHGGCIVPSALLAKTWFDSLKQ